MECIALKFFQRGHASSLRGFSWETCYWNNPSNFEKGEEITCVQFLSLTTVTQDGLGSSGMSELVPNDLRLTALKSHSSPLVRPLRCNFCFHAFPLKLQFCMFTLCPSKLHSVLILTDSHCIF